METQTDKIIKEITNYYLTSHDFNGIALDLLSKKFNIGWEDFKSYLLELIRTNIIRLIFSDSDINPHIIRTGFQQKEIQLSKITTKEVPQACIYPTPEYLLEIVDRKKYGNKPYQLCLALGEPQLAYRSFDLSVLEFYRNDPRYSYDNNDVSGKICYASDDLQKRDQVILQTFGFSYDKNYNRAVAVFVRYLSDLSAEHQQIWKTKELNDNFKLHPDYYRNSIIGDWGSKVPICSAILKEIFIINQMSKAMEREQIFKKDFGEYGDERPAGFGFLIRTTLEEFNNFVLLLDKIFSDNINKKFFQKDVPLQNEIIRKDGKIEIQNKGTLQILDEWIRKFFNTDDWELWNNSIQTFKKVRKLRQKPAHKISDNLFDQEYFKKQRKLIIEAYNAVRTLRLLLANHPKVIPAEIKIPKWLQEGRIWTQ